MQRTQRAIQRLARASSKRSAHVHGFLATRAMATTAASTWNHSMRRLTIAPSRRYGASMGFCSTTASENAPIAIGDRVYVHMQGRLSNGKEFGKTEEDRPISFLVGGGDVIVGIEEAIVGMQKGTSKSVEIEPSKAFGADKQIYAIPRKEMKLSPSEQEMLKVGNHLQLQQGQAARIVSVTDETVEIDLSHEFAGETLYVDLKVVDHIPSDQLSAAERLVLPEEIVAGDNVTFPQRGDTLVMHYTGKLASNGQVFDSSVTRGEPFQFVIGVGQVIQGWDEGVMRMSKGQKAILNIPSAKGYGRSGAGDVIPPNADLIFEVELLDVIRS